MLSVVVLVVPKEATISADEIALVRRVSQAYYFRIIIRTPLEDLREYKIPQPHLLKANLDLTLTWLSLTLLPRPVPTIWTGFQRAKTVKFAPYVAECVQLRDKGFADQKRGRKVALRKGPISPSLSAPNCQVVSVFSYYFFTAVCVFLFSQWTTSRDQSRPIKFYC